jgi:hypothetical protein
MKLKLLRLTLRSDAPMHGDASKLRGFFAASFNEYALLHQHMADKLIYKYPLIQYKMLGQSPMVLGIEDGAEVLKEIYDKFDEIKIGDSKYAIVERGITVKSEEFGCAQEIASYRFVTPWIALSQKNHQRYLDFNQEERRELLRSILVGNILSASKGLGYVATERIKLDIGRVYEKMCTLKGTPVVGFKGEFMANFMIPDYIGLGKSVSRGFGTIEKMK